jgi:hypothetical protein
VINKIVKYWPFVFIGVVCLVYFWKVFLKDFVPFPGDILVGAYLPWLESKWGTTTGIPFKANSSTPDVYSQFFLWKSLIAESFRNLQWPLWNPYSYSGYPLLANFHSGALYPFNLFMVLLGDVNGWSALIIFGVVGSFTAMYLLLRRFKMSQLAALLGGLAYSFSGFSISWSQFINAVQAMVWLPLMILCLDRYFEYKKLKNLFWLPFLFFLFFSAGHFQITVYGSIILVLFILWKLAVNFKLKNILVLLPVLFMVVGFSAIQILPTMEMASNGIRLGDHALEARNYGLSPIRNLINLFAPDFFGNPVTANFWGFFNYHETIFYSGLITSLAMIWVLFLWKYISREVKFFWVIAILALLFGFDTPFGRAIYSWKIPGLSTSDAGRIAAVYVLGGSIVLAGIMDQLGKVPKKIVALLVVSSLILFGVLLYLADISQELWGKVATGSLTAEARRIIALRNLAFPSGLLFLILGTIIFFRKRGSFLLVGLIFILLIDVFRFGWKYTAFVPKLYMYPDTPMTIFLKEKNAESVIRIDREKAEIMPNATWMAFRLMSPSGYDPMALREYVSEFDSILNHRPNSSPSRYSEIDAYDAEALGKFNVKYLLVVKRDKDGKISGNNINGVIDLKQWPIVFETSASAVLQNTKYLERARIVNSNGSIAKGTAQISSYKSNKVVLRFTNENGDKLLLADTYYPGWVATIDGKITKIGNEIKPFRTVDIRGIKSGEVVFEYKPDSFRIGMWISIVSIITWLTILFFGKRNEK